MSRVSALSRAKTIVRDAMDATGASSATFYVRDPWYLNELRIAVMEGVWAPETMHGFLSAVPSDQMAGKRRENPDRRFFKNVRDDVTVCPPPDLPLADLVRRHRLWGSFSVREEVVSAIRHRLLGTDGSIDAMLWLNFKNAVADSKKTRTSTRFFEDLLQMREAVATELATTERFPIIQVDRILQVSPDLSAGLLSFEDHLQRVVDSLLPTFGIDEKTGLGSAFLFRPELGELDRVAHAGYRHERQTTKNNISKGQGIVSWVALRKRSLLVRDAEGLQRFRSAGIYLEVDRRTKSELAVPILLDSELIGVLNFESRAAKSPFTAQSLRALWYAASQAAMAHRLSERTAVVRQLLTIAERATKGSAPESVIRDLESEGQKWIKSDLCRIWYRPIGESQFIDPGGRNQSARPRSTGWTSWVARHQCPVWIHQIEGDTKYKVKFWSQEGSPRWGDTPPTVSVPLPPGLNPHRNREAVCALGTPIIVAGEHNSAMWFIYLGPSAEPSAVTVQDAIGFAGQAGLVEEIIRHKTEAVDRAKQAAEFAQRFKEELFRMPDQVAGIDFCVRQQPKQNAFLGGDFYGVEKLDENRTCFILGDVMGKGEFAALGMIPMVTLFRESCAASVSTRQVLSNLESAAWKWHVKGTAICFAVDVAAGRLFGASAGHHPLIIIRPKGKPDSFPREGIGEYDSLGEAKPTRQLGEGSLPIEAGSVVVAYTDGVSDAGWSLDEDDAPLKRRRIEQSAQVNRHKSAEEIADAIMKAALGRADNNPEDDLAIMVVKIL